MAKRYPQENKQKDGTKMVQNSPKNSTRTTKGGNPKGKGKRDGSGEFKETGDGYPKQRGGNNPAWHSPDAKLLEQSAALSWSYQAGELMRTGYLPNSNQASQAGIMVIREKISFGGLNVVTPSGGRVADFAMPATVAANTLLTEMRSKIRLRNTYDAPDVAMLMLAMANLYAGVFLAKRLVSTVKAFAYQNEYLPRALFKAQGFDYNWFRANMFDFVSELNVLISELNKVYVPNRMHLFNLINERFSNYYSEGENIRDQIYMFTPAMLCAIDYTPTTDYASCLTPVMIMPGKWKTSYATPKECQYDANSLHTGVELLAILKYMLGMIVNHDSTPDITGDMMNAFGETDRFLMPPADPSIIAVPVLNEEIMEVIHNTKICSGVFYNFISYDGSTAVLEFKTIQLPSTNEIGDYDCWKIPAGYVSYCDAEKDLRIVDVHKDPNPYKTMEVTRLRNDVVASAVESGDNYVTVQVGAETVCQICIYDITSSGLRETTINNTVNNASTSWATIMGVRSPFHYAPLMLPINIANGGTNPGQWYIGESDIYAELPFAYQRNMNRISLMTLLGAYDNLK